MTTARVAFAARILAGILLFARLGGLTWLPPAPVSAAALVALLAFDAWRRGGGTWATLRQRFGWYPVALGALLVLTLLVRLPALGSDLGHQPPDIDGHRLAASIRHYFLTGDIKYRTVEHYPGLVFWAMGGSALAAFVWGLMTGTIRAVEFTTVEQFMLAGRAINVVFAVGLVACVSATAHRLSGRAAALAAGLVVALAPLSIETTTDMRNDPGQVLLLVATVLAALAARASHVGRGFSPVNVGQGFSPVSVGQGFSPVSVGQGFSPVSVGQGLSPVSVGQGLSPVQVGQTLDPALLIAGACAGLATGVKYTSVFVLVPVLLAALEAPVADRLRRVVAAAAAFMLALAASNHFLWWDFPNFLRQLSDQVQITGATHWAATDNPSAMHRQVLATVGPGWALLLLAAGWGVWSLSSGRRDAWVFWVFPVLYSWFTTHRPSQFPRWVFPLLPFVAVAGACGLVALAGAARRSPAWARTSRPTLPRLAMAALVAAALAPPVWGGVAALSRRVEPTTAVLLERWLAERVEAGQVVLAENGWLDLQGALFKVTRVPDLAWALGPGRRALGTADLVVVPETHFATPGLSGLALVHTLEATPRAFGGHLGFDYRVYAVPPLAPVEAVEIRLDDPSAEPALGWDWGAAGGRGPGRLLPDRSAVVYLPPITRGDGVLNVDLAGAGDAGSPVPVVVTANDRPVPVADVPATEAGLRRLGARVELPRAGRATAVRIDPVKRGARLRVVAVRLGPPR